MGVTQGYPDGAGMEACSDMVPQHGPYTQPQRGWIPYTITVDNMYYTDGARIQGKYLYPFCSISFYLIHVETFDNVHRVYRDMLSIEMRSC